LAPGLLSAGDVAHQAALVAPRNLIVAGGTDPQGKALDEKGQTAALAFTTKAYGLAKAKGSLVLKAEMEAAKVVEGL
jgi:hypothetical protein